jgi:hypothetical protein
VNSNEADEWRKAMDAKIDSPHILGVWKLTTLPADRKAIGCKWVFKRKYDAQGNLQKYKARLVAKGYNQKVGSIIVRPLHQL